MINWKVRIKQKWFWLAMFSLLTILAQQLGFAVPKEIEPIFNTVLSLLVTIGIVQDPTTRGFEDSQRALSYTEPR